MSHEPIEVKNWRNELSEYQKGKREALPALYRNPYYIPRVTHSVVKSQEYKFDPILNRFKEPELDSCYYSQSVGRIKKLAALTSQTNYNIVTLEDCPNELLEVDAFKNASLYPSHRPQPFNIISNEVYNPEHKLFRIRRKKLPDELNREYNIITNKYTANHEERTKVELESKRRVLERKYVSTHDFDPIRCVHYFGEKENQAQQVERQKLDDLIKKKSEKIPPSYKIREPINLNHEKNIVQSDGFQLYKNKENGRVKKYKKKYEFEATTSELARNREDRAERLCLGRYYAKRFVEEYKNGIDPLNLQEITKENTRLEFAKGNQKEHYLPFPKPSKKLVNYFGFGF